MLETTRRAWGRQHVSNVVQATFHLQQPLLSASDAGVGITRPSLGLQPVRGALLVLSMQLLASLSVRLVHWVVIIMLCMQQPASNAGVVITLPSLGLQPVRGALLVLSMQSLVYLSVRVVHLAVIIDLCMPLPAASVCLAPMPHPWVPLSVSAARLEPLHQLLHPVVAVYVWQVHTVGREVHLVPTVQLGHIIQPLVAAVLVVV